MAVLHANNFATNLTSAVSATDTTSPLNSIPTCDAPFYLAFDATNINGKYEVVYVTSKTATNVNHAALSYDHTIAEEVRCVAPAEELDAVSSGWMPMKETLTYSSADAPTYVCTTSTSLVAVVGVGSRIKLTHGGSTKYFIVTAVDATTITLYGGTDYTLAATAITLPYYSIQKAPFGFPLDPTKWTVQNIQTVAAEQTSPSAATWYNKGGSLSIPIGVWKVNYQIHGYTYSDNLAMDFGTTLSTTNNSESNANWTYYSMLEATKISVSKLSVTHTREGFLVLTSKATYYLNVITTKSSLATMYVNSGWSPTIIRAVCSYL